MGPKIYPIHRVLEDLLALLAQLGPGQPLLMSPKTPHLLSLEGILAMAAERDLGLASATPANMTPYPPSLETT